MLAASSQGLAQERVPEPELAREPERELGLVPGLGLGPAPELARVGGVAYSAHMLASS